jgi:hypothetical protein
VRQSEAKGFDEGGGGRQTKPGVSEMSADPILPTVVRVSRKKQDCRGRREGDVSVDEAGMTPRVLDVESRHWWRHGEEEADADHARTPPWRG